MTKVYRVEEISSTQVIDGPHLPPSSNNMMYSSEYVIELASRLCYNSIDKLGTNPNFIKGLIKAEHLDVLEHARSVYRVFLVSNSSHDLKMNIEYFTKLQLLFPYMTIVIRDARDTIHSGGIKEEQYLVKVPGLFENDDDYDGHDGYMIVVDIGGNFRSWLELSWNEEVQMDLSWGVLESLVHIFLLLNRRAPNIFSALDMESTFVAQQYKKYNGWAAYEDLYTQYCLVGDNANGVQYYNTNNNYSSSKRLGLVIPVARGVHSAQYNVERGKTVEEEMAVFNHMVFWASGVSRAFTHQHVRHRLLSFCLAGDTIIRSYSSKSWTIQKLYEWSQDPKRSGRLKLIQLRGMNEKREIVPVTIKNIVYSGKQRVYRLTTKSGRSIRATALHRFMTPNGWKSLEELNVGDEVYSNGIAAYKDKEYLHQRYIVENTERKVLAQELGVSDSTLGKWINKFGLQKERSNYPGRVGNPNGVTMTQEIRDKISEKMTGSNNHRWKNGELTESGGRLRANRMHKAENCSECGSSNRVQRHHIDGDVFNNNVDNIAILCEPHHQARHKIGKKLTFRDEIVSIEIDEIIDTYDIEVNEDVHNFVADGIIVHNSQLSQRYVDFTEKQKGDFVYPENLTEEQFDIYRETFWYIEEQYKKLRKSGVKKEDARAILPNAAETSIIFSGTQRGLEHYIVLRTAPDAQSEIRKIANKVETYYNIFYPA